MSTKTISTKILLRNDTAANWVTENPILGKGEMGVEIDTQKFKFGDGIHTWNELGYGHSADIPPASPTTAGTMSAADFVKLSNIEENAEENVIETVKVNGTALVPDANKAVDVEVPTKTSDLTNDGDGSDNNSPFATQAYVSEHGGKIDKIQVNGTEQTITNKTVNIPVPEAATTAPAMDGTAAVGTGTTWARADHVHPSDTSKADAADLEGLETRVQTAENDIDALETNKADKATTLAGYGITDAYTKTEVDAKLASVFDWKGSVATVADLPATGNKSGDVYHVTADQSEYVWNGTAWEELGLTVSLTGYATETWVTQNFATAAQGAKADTAVQGVKIGNTTFAVDSTSRVASASAADLKTELEIQKVEASATNGNIKIDNVETTVYTLPSTTVDSTDFLILNCGDATTEAPNA